MAEAVLSEIVRTETPVHSKLIANAARATLVPMGLFQKSRSRTWLDDHGWWLCVVEFQPSTWSRGSYLNVGCMWLWQVKNYLSFDEGYRVEAFVEIDDEEHCLSLARRAADEVEGYRKRFPRIDEVCNYYLRTDPVGLWPNFNAAVACALAGRVSEARAFFAKVAKEHDDREWVLAARAEAEELSSIMADSEQFRGLITDRVRKTRALQKLPHIPTVDFDG